METWRNEFIEALNAKPNKAEIVKALGKLEKDFFDFYLDDD